MLGDTKRVRFTTTAILASVAMLAVAAPPAAAVSPDVVISQVYGGGGNAGATYTHDYVELFNRGTATVELAGWSVQYASATGTTWQTTALAGSIAPGKYYLVQQAQGAGGSMPLPQPNAIGTIAMGATSGKVALVRDSAALTCGADCDSAAPVRDFVGYGSANDSETAPAPSPSSSTAIARAAGGATDTDHNASDFVTVSPNPRSTPPPPPPASGCDTQPTLQIGMLQGPGTSTPFAGQSVRVEGVVTGDFQAPDQLRGFFLQDDTPDTDPATSDGVFAFGGNADVAVGDRVLVSGTAVEFNGLTQLTSLSAVDVCGTGSVTATPYDLPRPAGTTFEPHESVLVTFPESLTATEHFQLGRFGEVTVSSDGRLVQPTQTSEPGAPAADSAAAAGRRRLLVDDGSNVQNPAVVPFTAPGSVLRLGDTARGVTGVLSFGFGLFRLQPTTPIAFERANPRPVGPAAVGGDIRVASFNTLNYFTTLGADNPDARGADTPAELDRQRAKAVAAIAAMDADVLGLMEVENNGATAISDLVGALNDATAPGRYAYVTEPVLNAPNEFGGQFGTDAIKVALIYQPAAVAPVGAPWSSGDPVFDRPPLIQTFEPVDGGERFTVVVNHLKSKSCGGATGPDIDQRDGQSCFNARRTDQAAALTALIDSLNVPSPLVVGDLNAYAQEDPIALLEGAGYTDLARRFDPGTYSYVFDGFAGTLDYALAGHDLLDNVTGATIWHINADEPLILDYNTEFNPPSLYHPDAYRSSDHDPVIVGLDLVSPPAAPVVSALAGWGAATVSWQEPDDGGSAITGYTVRALVGGAVVQTSAVAAAQRSVTFGDLADGVAHTFEVVASNSAGAGLAGTATAMPFVPRDYARLDAAVACPSFTAANPNTFPVSVGWSTSRGATGSDVVPAGASIDLAAPFARDGATVLFLSAGGRRQDQAAGRC